VALAPYPTTTMDGETVYAQPARSGQPRNAWIALDARPDGKTGKTVWVEWLGGSNRASVAARVRGMRIIETAAYVWTPTSARKAQSAF
jgi:hypothetical protein